MKYRMSLKLITSCKERQVLKHTSGGHPISVTILLKASLLDGFLDATEETPLLGNLKLSDALVLTALSC